MVNDGVDDNLDASSVAGIHHVLEGRAVAKAAGNPVRHGLVRGPPLRALDVLSGRRDLDKSVAGGTNSISALFGDGVEVPLKKDSSDVLGARRGGIDDRRGHDHEASSYVHHNCNEASLACHYRGLRKLRRTNSLKGLCARKTQEIG